MTDNVDMLDAAYEAVENLSAARLAAYAQARRDIGVAAALQYIRTFLAPGDSNVMLMPLEYMAVHVCGIGTPHSATGEEDLSPEARALEFLQLPELKWLREGSPSVVEFLAGRVDGGGGA